MSAGYTHVRRLLGWPDPRQVALSALIGILLAFYAWRFLLPLLGPQAPRADDFQDYLFAAQQIATGGDPYANFVRNHVPWDWSLSSGYLYPPAFAVILIPLTWISNDLAVRIWLFFIQAAVLASLLIIYRVIGRPSRAELLALVAVLTTFFPLANTVLAGTMNSLLLLLLTGAWACWHRRRDVAGGVLVGAAAVFKLFPAALLPYLAWRRHWKLLAAAAVTGLAGVGLGLAVTSLDHNIYYFREMLPHLAAGTGYRENQSLAGVAARICDPDTTNAGGSAGWCGRLIDWPAVLVLLTIVWRLTSRASRSGLEFALAVTALPLISRPARQAGDERPHAARANPRADGRLGVFLGGTRRPLPADRLSPPPLDQCAGPDAAGHHPAGGRGLLHWDDDRLREYLCRAPQGTPRRVSGHAAGSRRLIRSARRPCLRGRRRAAGRLP